MNQTNREFVARMGQSTPELPRQFSLLSLWRIIRTQIWLILFVTCVFMALGYLMTRFNEQTYTAETVLVLEDFDAALTSTVSGDVESLDNASTAVEVFGSRQVIKMVVDRLELMQNPQFNPYLHSDESLEAEGTSLLDRVITPVSEAIIWARAQLPRLEIGSTAAIDADESVSGEPKVEQIRQTVISITQSRIQFQAEPGSPVIRVRARTATPQMSADLANTAAEVFLEELLNTRLDSLERVVELLGSRVVELREELRAREDVLQFFVNSAELIDPEQLASLGEEAAQLRSRLTQSQQELSRAEALASEAETLVALSPAEIEAEIDRSENLRELAGATGGTDNTEVAARMLEEAERRVSRHARLIERLTTSLEELENRIAISGREILRYQQLQREVDASAEIYSFSVRRLNELSVQGGIEGGGGRIISQAEAPLASDEQGGFSTVIVLGILGLMTAVGWVLVREATNQRIRNEDDLSMVLPGARIVLVPPAPRRGLFDSRCFAQRMLLWPKPTFYSESVRRLRTTILQNTPPNRSVALHTASDIVSKGKTLLTIALARSFVLIGKRVLLIEADMRNGGEMARQLRIAMPANGIQDVITGDIALTDAVQHHKPLGIDLLVTRKSGDNPSDLLEHPGFAALVREALANYDVVLIDTPPVLAAPDALAAARHVSRTIFVVGCNASSSESLTQAIEDLPGGLTDRDILALYGAYVSRQRRVSRTVRKFARL